MSSLFETPRYIAIEGPIRAGKSSLAQLLAGSLHAQLLHEPEENAFLGDFYKDKPGAAFQSQMAFLLGRYQQLLKLEEAQPRHLVIADYLFEKDRIFANLNLSDEELAVYDGYQKLFRQRLRQPDLVIYLQASVETLQQRLKKKAQPQERRISEEYLESVVRAYEYFFFHYSATDLLIVNTNQMDFVERSRDLQQLLRKLSEPIKGTQYFLPLTEDAG
jgi:deoxyadenosine/deoxycytidine kinase